MYDANSLLEVYLRIETPKYNAGHDYSNDLMKELI